MKFNTCSCRIAISITGIIFASLIAIFTPYDIAFIQFVEALLSISILVIGLLAMLVLSKKGIIVKIILTSLFIFSFLLVKTFPSSSISNNDMHSIYARVQEQTSEPVLNVEKVSPWTVEVMTGNDGLPNMTNRGSVFYLRRKWRGWQITRVTSWVS